MRLTCCGLKLGQIVKAHANVVLRVNKTLSDKRMTICKRCEHQNGPFCKKCGCNMPAKTTLDDSRCPIGKW